MRKELVNIVLLVALLGCPAIEKISCAYAQANPYISRVYEFVPAPGQFTNILPEYEDDDTKADMIEKAEEQLVNRTDGMISLGAWGGYVTFGFDHSLVNVPGEYDLLVYGNAFISNVQMSQDTLLGSSEPGIVYVSRDENNDGLPNDTWYEIAGSETLRGNRQYQVTYVNTGRSHIPWTDNVGGSGAVLRNKYHTQASYFPLWRENESSATYSGTLLPPNVYSDNNAYVLDFGYVDNWPNDDDRSKINLDWAIDADGNPANLVKVDFVRVMTGVMASGSLTGEASTEVCGARDLHPDAEVPTDVHSVGYNLQTMKCLRNGSVVILKNGEKYSILGTKIN